MDTTPKECPNCCATDLTWKSKVQQWECNACEARFAPRTTRPSLEGSAPSPRTIFFSYGHDANQPLVDAFKADLERRGHSVWIDYKEIGTWQDWRGRIAQGVHDSDLAVAFLSKHSMRDPGVCRNEVALALNRFGTVYPVLLEPLQQVSPPVTISHLQWQDLTQWQSIRDGRVPGKDWPRWYEERLLQLVTLVEGEASEFSGDIQSLREVLRPVPFASDIARHVTDFVGREWVFDAYRDWLEHRNGSRLLWVKGGPGVGKSAIAAQLVHNHQAAIVGAWFCQAHSIERRDARNALCSLAFQLACRWDDYRRKLRFQVGLRADSGPGDWHALRESLLARNEGDLFHLFFEESLQGLIWREHRLAVVIDALDEATDEHGRNPLLDLLVARLASLPPWLVFVVTSRPDPAVVARLGSFAPFEFDAQAPNNRDDLCAYLVASLSTREAFLALDAPVRQRVVEQLLANSEGMILYLRQAIAALDEGALTLDTLGDVPRGLGSLYRIAFDGRFGSSDTARRGFDEHLRPLLRLLVAAPGPLPSTLAGALLGVSREQWLAVRERLGSYVVEDADGLRLFHKTLDDWLTSEASGPYHCDPAAGAATLGDFLVQCCGNDDAKARKWQPWVQRWLPVLAPLQPWWDDWNFLLALSKYFSSVLGQLAAADTFLRRASEVLEAQGAARSRDMASVLRERARLLQRSNEHADADALHAQVLGIEEAALGRDAPGLVPTLVEVVHALWSGTDEDRTGRRARQEDLLRRAIGIYRHAEGDDTAALVPLYLELGRVLRVQERFDEARDTFLAAAHLQERLGILPEDHYSDPDAELRRLDADRERAMALQAPFDALASLERRFGPDHEEVEDYALVLARDVGTDAARALYARALTIRQKRLGPDAPEVAWLLDEIASRADLHDAQARRELQSRVVTSLEKAHGPRHPELAEPVRMLSAYCAAAGDVAAESALLDRYVALVEGGVAQDSPELAEALEWAASQRTARGDAASGVALMERALAIRESVLRCMSNDGSGRHGVELKVAVAVARLAESLCDARRFADAEAHARRALSLFEAAYADRFIDGGPFVADAALQMGRALAGQGRNAEAQSHLQRALAIREKKLDVRRLHALQRYVTALAALAPARAALAELDAAAMLIRQGDTRLDEAEAEGAIEAEWPGSLAPLRAVLDDAAAAVALHGRAA